MTDYALEVRGARKHFGGVRALRGMSLAVRAGEVHGLLGENGAGKSTLIGVCTGAVRPDEGSVLVRGQELSLGNPRAAAATGVAVVRQEPPLAATMTVLQNVLLPEMGRRRWSGSSSLRRHRPRVQRVLGELGIELDLDADVDRLTVAGRQLVEIVKAVLSEPSVLFLDEPNSALSEADTQRLLSIVRRMASSGAAVVLVSHRLTEVFSVANALTVMRDGEHVWTGPTAETSIPQTIQRVVGREVARVLDPRPSTAATPAVATLETRGLTRAGEFEDVSLTVRAGEIVGLAGLMGAGRTELAAAIYGLTRPHKGELLLENKHVRWRRPVQAVRAGISLVSEDRKREGIFPTMSVAWNLQSTARAIGRRDVGPAAKDISRRLGIKCASLAQPASELSGGNQQKVVLGRALLCRPKVLILDEPTRGVDVVAKADIYSAIRALAADGMAVLLISSELEEVLEISNRLYVMRLGRLVAEFGERPRPEEVMSAAFGEVS